MWHSKNYLLLSMIGFFKNFRLIKFFAQWRHITDVHWVSSRRNRLVKRLLACKPVCRSKNARPVRREARVGTAGPAKR